MPLYEYRCGKCTKVFEVLQKFADSPLKKHPACGGKVERLISAPGLHFKGSGFYLTDYGKSGSDAGSKAKSESSAESKSSEAKPETKAETKTETKSESKAESKTEAKPAKKAS